MKDAVSTTEKSIHVSQDAYIASKRPWVSVEATISSDLVKKPDGIEFSINFIVKNHGESPAINVHIVPEVVTLKSGADPFGDTRQKITSLGVDINFGENMGIHLFPSEKEEILWKIPLSSKEIEDATKSCTPLTDYSLQFILSVPFFINLLSARKFTKLDLIIMYALLATLSIPGGLAFPISKILFLWSGYFLIHSLITKALSISKNTIYIKRPPFYHYFRCANPQFMAITLGVNLYIVGKWKNPS